MAATAIDTQKENADLLITYANDSSYTITAKPHVIVEGRGVRKTYYEGCYEVTGKKLESLQNHYSCECDF